MDVFDTLSQALDGWFESSLTTLPQALRLRIGREFFPLDWEQLSPVQRRIAAEQLDSQRDPAIEGEWQRSWDLADEERGLKRQIEQWQLVSAPTASDLGLKESKLLELRSALDRVQAQDRREPQMEQVHERRQRLMREVEAERASGTKAFLIAVAARNRISVPRLKQLIKLAKSMNQERATWIDPISSPDRASRKKPKP